MKNDQKERRHLSHHALVESAIRMTKQLAASNDIMTRSLANRMFSDLTLLRRGLPNRRLHEHGNVKGAVLEEVVTPEVEQTQVEQQMAVNTDAQISEPAIVMTALEREIAQTRERCAAQATVLCVVHASDNHCQLRAVTPQREQLGALDAVVEANAVDQMRSMGVAAKISGPQTRVIYFTSLMPELGLFARHGQSLGPAAHWVLTPADDHPLAMDDAFWQTVAASAALGEVDTDDGARLQARAQRKEIPHAGEVKCWATCLLVTPVDGDREQAGFRLLTNLALPDLAHARELLEWRSAITCTVFSPPQEYGMPAHLLASPRLDQMAWSLEHESTALAADCFSEEEILAAHLLTKQSVPSGQISLTQVSQLLACLGQQVHPEAPLAAGLQRMEDAVIGLLAK